MEEQRNQALAEFAKHIETLYEAIVADDYQKQLVALSQSISSLQDAKKATAATFGGLLN